MSKELDEIRAKKVAEIAEKMADVEEAVADIQAMQKEFTWADFGFDEPEWGFKESDEMDGAFDICQRHQMVAMTADPRWAMLVTDLLNRAKLEELIMNHNQEGEIDG